ncbi:uncharacterized protein LTR77_010507 [Saxophila tyrrhenica]|uniref:Extracellular serine-rich protein n=1 Tax=Saxophila tyrrhenica TaxID=1690608 RepID=A0AAV9NV31_9PEZI|nr:hypothetical protein LTR77_010507 [Saxophila tyrrhenica]
MILLYLTAASALFGSACSQKTRVEGQVGAENSTTPSTKEGDHTMHYVTVGKNENNYYPNSIVASPGDIISFQFYPLNHSVIKAAYGFPCIPYEDTGLPGNTFYSGWMPVAQIQPDPPVWNLTINDTEPVFYYCGAPGSCIDWGMVGVINANASTSISTQIALARQADFQLLPGEPFPNEAQQASMASLAATATTASLTVTATAASESGSGHAHGHDQEDYDDRSDSSSSSLSTGAIAGIAVGAGIGGIADAALFFLMCRTRSLKRQLDQQQATAQHPHHSWFNNQSRHASSLPPYQGIDQHGRDSLKPEGVGGLGSERSQSVSPQPTPYQVQQGQFVPYRPMEQRYTQMTSASELSGPRAPPVELDALREQTHTGLTYRDYR